MPQPTAGDVHVNTPLTNISVAYMQNRNDFIATRVAPNIPVQRQSDRYYVYDKRYWMKTEAEKRAPGAPSAGSGFQVISTPSYFADVFAVHKDVPDQIRANTDRPLDADRDATTWVTSQMLLKREKEFANTFIKQGVWSTEVDLNASGQTKWDASGANPIDNVQEQAVEMMRNTGMRPNVAIMTPDVERVLANNSLVLDRIKYTSVASSLVTCLRRSSVLTTLTSFRQWSTRARIRSPLTIRRTCLTPSRLTPTCRSSRRTRTPTPVLASSP